jgi:hypothetical protein
MAIIPTAKANRSGSAIAIPYTFLFCTLMIPEKKGFLLDKAGPESTVKHVATLRIFDLVPFLKRARTGLFVFGVWCGFLLCVVAMFCVLCVWFCLFVSVSGFSVCCVV